MHYELKMISMNVPICILHDVDRLSQALTLVKDIEPRYGFCQVGLQFWKLKVDTANWSHTSETSYS